MQTPISYPNPPVRPQWLSLHTEDVIEPEIPIIDSHHHFFDQHGPHATQPYLLEELREDFDTGHTVVGRVYVQAGWRVNVDGPVALRSVSETAASAAIARSADAKVPGLVNAGIVSYADLRDPELDAVLDAHIAAGAGRFRGVRQSAALDSQILPMTTVVPQKEMMRSTDFQRGLRLLGARGLTCDAWQYHPQLGDLLLAARAAPDTVIVIDHLGGPLRCGAYRTKEKTMHADWLASMTALARCPNVYVKLGGLGMTINGFNYHESPLPPTSLRLASNWEPWIEPCIEKFGAERCMFESNFPVDKGMFSYRTLWNAFKRLAIGASESEKQQLFHATAARVYRLDGMC